MEINTIGRPRNVGWLRAAALLYGDWGTSKAYVIGLGLAAVGYSALPHLLAVCLLTALVGVNYIWVCRCFSTGGGVYAAAGMHSRRLAMIGGNTRVNLDVPPFVLASDFNVAARGLNLVGLRRAGIGPEAIRQLKVAYRLLYRSQLSLESALERIEREVPTEEARQLVAFIRSSRRGICRDARSRRGQQPDAAAEE